MAQASTLLKKSREEARRLLQERIDRAVVIADGVESRGELDRAFEREKLWREYNIRLLEALFATLEYAHEYKNSLIPMSVVAANYYHPDIELTKSRLAASIRGQIVSLESIINRLELIEEEGATVQLVPPPDKARSLVMLAERFHLVARQMLKRHAGRSGFEIKDEYDVQDLVHALLTIYFEDIRKEEWTPSYAGGAVKMDFLLPELEAALELKMMRPSLTTKALGEELLIDIAKYQKHPGCRTLYCFVYDQADSFPIPGASRLI